MAEARDVDQDDGERVRTWDWPGTPEQRDAYLAEVGHDDGGEMFRQSLEAVRRADVDVRMPDGTYKSAQELTEADWAAASTRPPGAIRRLPG